MNAFALIPIATALVLSPLLRSVIDRTKAKIGGRQGPAWVQPYRELRRFFAKGAVYSDVSSWLVKAGPIVNLASILTVMLFIPFPGLPAVIHFQGDLLVVVGLFAAARLAMILAALDVGSAFEGMGASREAVFGALAEPVVLLAFAGLARETGLYSFTDIYAELGGDDWQRKAPALLMVLGALFIVLLVENARIPVDDPTTHLELTMIHEVMILDHSGPDMGLLEYGAMLKLWTLGNLIVGLALSGLPVSGVGMFALKLGGLFILGVGIGLIESGMARLRMVRVPDLIFGGVALAALSVLIQFR